MNFEDSVKMLENNQGNLQQYFYKSLSLEIIYTTLNGVI